MRKIRINMRMPRTGKLFSVFLRHSHEFADSCRRNGSQRSKGFTLIELLVSMAIFIVVTGIVVVNQGSFGGSVLITNLAYDVALSVRQAQVYGISARKVTAGVIDPSGIEQFDRSYGVHFGQQTGNFILFADISEDGQYDTNSDDGTNCKVGYANPECISFLKIEKGNTISGFCGDATCKSGGAINSLDILFHRPNPEPIIYGLLNGVRVDTAHNSASVTVSTPQGKTKLVCVSVSGQIYVKNECP